MQNYVDFTSYVKNPVIRREGGKTGDNMTLKDGKLNKLLAYEWRS